MSSDPRIELLCQMIDEKNQEKKRMQSQLESIQSELKQIDLTINAFQLELQKLTGEKVEEARQVIKGVDIGERAIEALERLGREAHYTEVKDEIEKSFIISGITEKSKTDSVWTYLNKSEDVIKMGRGAFKLKSNVISSDEKKEICRKYGLEPDRRDKKQWDMFILFAAQEQLTDEELLEFLTEMTQKTGKDWIEYYRKIMTQGKKTPRI